MVREEKLWRVCELVLFCFFPVKKKKKKRSNSIYYSVIMIEMH